MRPSTHRSRPRVIGLALAIALLLGTVVGLAGCAKAAGSAGSAGSSSPVASVEATSGQFPADKPDHAQTPPPPMLRNPQSAVYSYLVWISYAYRILNSDVATMAFSPNEEVRVNSYVELNREKSRAIDQHLVDYRVKSVQSKGSTATVGVREQWMYRYIDIKTAKYNSAILNATYDTTYTVVKGKTGWLVESVSAKTVGSPVK